jgi:hypothetical protein
MKKAGWLVAGVLRREFGVVTGHFSLKLAYSAIRLSQGEAIASGRRKLRNDADRKQQETNILINAINGIANIASHLPQKLIFKDTRNF